MLYWFCLFCNVLFIWIIHNLLYYTSSTPPRLLLMVFSHKVLQQQYHRKRNTIEVVPYVAGGALVTMLNSQSKGIFHFLEERGSVFNIEILISCSRTPVIVIRFNKKQRINLIWYSSFSGEHDIVAPFRCHLNYVLSSNSY